MNGGGDKNGGVPILGGGAAESLFSFEGGVELEGAWPLWPKNLHIRECAANGVRDNELYLHMYEGGRGGRVRAATARVEPN